MMLKNLLGYLASAALVILSASASATLVTTQTCGTSAKSMSFSDASAAYCSAQNGGSPAQFEALVAPALSVHYENDLTAGNTLGVFNFLFSNGSWGQQSASGTWSITDSSFWNTHQNLWIGFHVATAPSISNPDKSKGAPKKIDDPLDMNLFLFHVTESAMGGNWSYLNQLSGGGFSAIHFWFDSKPYTPPPPGGDNPPPTKVPEPSGLLLMVLGLAGLRFARRSIR